MRRAERLIEKAKAALPELRSRLDADLALIKPDDSDDDSGFVAYKAYGSAVFDFLREALIANRNDEARRVFALTEDLALSGETYAQSVVATEIAYQLVSAQLNARARLFMGPATEELLKTQEDLVARATRRRNRIVRFIERLIRPL